MDKKEIMLKMEGADDFIKMFSYLMGNLSTFAGKPMTKEEKENLVELLMGARRVLRERYEGQIKFIGQMK